jgi:hypothetical protein
MLSPLQQARTIALGRVALGLTALAAPGFSGRAFVGSDGDRPSVRLYNRTLGVRDVAVGAGALASLRAGDPVSRWLLAGAFCDAVDTFAIVRAGNAVPAPARVGVSALAASGAVLGAALARRVP